jgi:hypothetical protein
LVKPSIVFFGESMPEKYYECLSLDFEDCDALIVMGTSLTVDPFARLVGYVGKGVPRLYINRETKNLGREGDMGRDAAWYLHWLTVWDGDCDAGVRELARGMGWEDELDALVEKWLGEMGSSKEEIKDNVTGESNDSCREDIKDASHEGEKAEGVEAEGIDKKVKVEELDKNV